MVTPQLLLSRVGLSKYCEVPASSCVFGSRQLGAVSKITPSMGLGRPRGAF